MEVSRLWNLQKLHPSCFVKDTASLITLHVWRSYPEDIIIDYSKIHDTIQDVKFWIAAKQGTNIGEFSLIYGGKLMEEDKPLLFH